VREEEPLEVRDFLVLHRIDERDLVRVLVDDAEELAVAAQREVRGLAAEPDALGLLERGGVEHHRFSRARRIDETFREVGVELGHVVEHASDVEAADHGEGVQIDDRHVARIAAHDVRAVQEIDGAHFGGSRARTAPDEREGRQGQDTSTTVLQRSDLTHGHIPPEPHDDAAPRSNG
jgi:hypothetical protein